MKYFSLISIGFQRAAISYSINKLLDDVHKRYMIYDRLNELGEYQKKDHILKSRLQFTDQIIKGINEINGKIKEYNAVTEDISGKAIKAELIKITPVRNKLKSIFQSKDIDETGYKLIAPYLEKEFMDYLWEILDEVLESLVDHKNITDNQIASLKLNTYPEVYRRDLRQMVDILIMGYKSTAILILGRVFEKQFKLWGVDLVRAKNIDKTDEEFLQMNFEGILGLFKSKKLISDKDWLILSKLRMDRNVGAHYLSETDSFSRRETEDEAEATIGLAMPLLKKYHLKSIQLKKK